MDPQYITEALTALDAFISVGVTQFDLARTDINRQRIDYRAGRNIGAMRLMLPELIPLAWQLSQNLIIRPGRPASGLLAQLDDLAGAQLERIDHAAFMVLETSPGNFQAWVKVEDADAQFVKWLQAGAGGDPRANGAGRIAGSPNCKPRYLPAFPPVRLLSVRRDLRFFKDSFVGSIVKYAKLGSKWNPPEDGRRRLHASPRGWPDYQRCLEAVARKKTGEPDRSAADYKWCKWALERDNSEDAVLVRLLHVSRKAREEWERGNQAYARRTVAAAAGHPWSMSKPAPAAIA